MHSAKLRQLKPEHDSFFKQKGEELQAATNAGHSTLMLVIAQSIEKAEAYLGFKNKVNPQLTLF